MAELSVAISVKDTDVFSELAKEVVFLRYFYKEAKVGMWPVSDEIYDLIKENYCGEIPEEYK